MACTESYIGYVVEVVCVNHHSSFSTKFSIGISPNVHDPTSLIRKGR